MDKLKKKKKVRYGEGEKNNNAIFESFNNNFPKLLICWYIKSLLMAIVLVSSDCYNVIPLTG